MVSRLEEVVEFRGPEASAGVYVEDVTSFVVFQGGTNVGEYIV